jgi:hypothetical protein
MGRLAGYRRMRKEEEGDAGGTNLRLANAVKTVCRQIGHLRLQILHLEMRVSLGGGHPSVAQQFLHCSQIGSGAQGVGGEGVRSGAMPC